MSYSLSRIFIAFSILVLGLFILAGYNQSSWQVCDAHCRVGGVHALSTRPDERYTSIRRSFDQCRLLPPLPLAAQRQWQSKCGYARPVAGIRCTLCTPLIFEAAVCPLPSIMKITSLNPPNSVGLLLMSSTRQRFSSAAAVHSKREPANMQPHRHRYRRGFQQ